MKYSIDKLTIAQIQAVQLDKDLLKELEARATFQDTDKSLQEVMVTIDTIAEIANEAEGRGHTRLANLADELYKQVSKFNYLQIAKV